jgi:hypothetical protein
VPNPDIAPIVRAATRLYRQANFLLSRGGRNVLAF